MSAAVLSPGQRTLRERLIAEANDKPSGTVPYYARSGDIGVVFWFSSSTGSGVSKPKVDKWMAGLGLQRSEIEAAILQKPR